MTKYRNKAYETYRSGNRINREYGERRYANRFKVEFAGMLRQLEPHHETNNKIIEVKEDHPVEQREQYRPTLAQDTMFKPPKEDP